MKKIEAIIRHFKLEDVKEAVRAIGGTGMTVYEVRGFGQQKQYQGNDFTTDFIPKMKVEIHADDSDVDAIVRAILTNARTGQVGDGRIIVTPIEQAYRIRTREDVSRESEATQ
jgi:nitrogen regulatory protein P-II 1